MIGGERVSYAVRVVRQALLIYRQHPVAVATVALVVFAPVSVIDSLVAGRVDVTGDEDTIEAAVAIVALLGTTVATLGSAVGAGLLDSVVAPHFGHDEVSLRTAFARLPKARLVGLDIAVSVIVAVGSLLAVIPGLLAFTLLCLSAPLLVRDHLGVRAAMKRSFDLTRRRLLVTFAIVTVPVLAEHQLLDAVEALWDVSFLVLLIAHQVLAVTVLAVVVLVEITLAMTLAHEEDHSDAHPQPLSL
jgi:hypothetical protein